MLVPKFTILDDVAGDVIFVRDDTKAYDANNTGGWGDPNQERNELALMVYATQVTDSGDIVASLVSDQIVWNVALTNSDQSLFQITLPDTDGVFDIYMFALKVTEDGINDRESNALVDDDIVYYNSSLYKRVSGSLVELTEEQYATELIDNANIPQSHCQEIVFPNILIKYSTKYKQYVKKIKENCEDVSDDFDEITEFFLDLPGMEYLFRSGLPIEARGVLEELHNKHDS